MVEATEVAEQIDRRLRYGHLILDELDEIVAEWNDLPMQEWLSWSQDWDQFALSIMRELSEYARDGEMIAKQTNDYQRLTQRIVDQTKAIESHRLTMPGIPARTR